MESRNRVADKMAMLQQRFQATKAFVEEGHSLVSVVQFINEQEDKEFVSIAYEAAAMGLALRGLEKGEALDTWQTFLVDYAEEHAVQVFIGLGWACAQQRLNPSSWVEELAPLLAWRIWDGYGYYDGFFRKRKVLQGVFPENISEKALSVYWQGVGRSFWYTCKGNIDKLQQIETKILATYRVDFWRGIGIASTYVGGQNLEERNKLWQGAGVYQPQLSAGAALAVKSRADANTITKDTEIIGQEWCRLSILKIVDLLKNKAIDSTVANEALYHTWIAEVDKAFNF